jgi:hypothetical protein
MKLEVIARKDNKESLNEIIARLEIIYKKI